MRPRSHSRRSITESNQGSCQYSRASSKKKYINVVSKGDTSENQTTPNLNQMRQSVMSLPPSKGIEYSGIRDFTPNHLGATVTEVAVVQRSSSQPRIDPSFSPTQKFIVRETVRAVPVNFKYMNHKYVNLNTVYGHNINHSLPTKK